MQTLDDNQMTLSMSSSKRSEKHKPEVNPDPEPLSSDSSESSSSDSRVRRKKRTKKKKRRKHRKYVNPTNQMTTDQGPGSILVCAFRYVLNHLLIESFDRLVEAFLIESQYSRYFTAQILL